MKTPPETPTPEAPRPANAAWHQGTIRNVPLTGHEEGRCLDCSRGFARYEDAAQHVDTTLHTVAWRSVTYEVIRVTRDAVGNVEIREVPRS